jgi:fumarylacetoacetase
MLDETHDGTIKSWVDSANGHTDFPLQNLPLGVFAPASAPNDPRIGIAIGDYVLDVRAAHIACLLTAQLEMASPSWSAQTVNPLLENASVRRALRTQVFALLREGSPARAAIEAGSLLHPRVQCQLKLPVRVGAYTDFFAGIHHAVNAGKQLRPDSPLSPNYKHVPIAYHSRASSIRVSDTPVRRPRGQRLAAGETLPRYEASQALDWELEFGIWIGRGNELGEPIDIAAASQHIAGFSLLNDWSARDIQRWEAQPLGPFLAKNFMSTVSPWVVTTEAMTPYRCAMPARTAGDPQPLPHLWDVTDQTTGMLDVRIEAYLLTPEMRATGQSPHKIGEACTLDLYWTPAQLVAHHTSNGCNLEPGDLLGSGTISAVDPRNAGCLLELTQGGRSPVSLPNGESRTYLQDGDEVIFRAHCERKGFARIGFGEARGVVQSARSGD